jgi:hypothetical protein
VSDGLTSCTCGWPLPAHWGILIRHEPDSDSTLLEHVKAEVVVQCPVCAVQLSSPVDLRVEPNDG